MSFDMLRNSVLNSLLLFAKVIPTAVGSAFWVTGHGPFGLDWTDCLHSVLPTLVVIVLGGISFGSVCKIPWLVAGEPFI